MSILIKGIEMPKDGEWVNVNICSDGSVYFVKSASNGFVFYGVRKGEAIEIPPHGRLIDKDALLEDIDSNHIVTPSDDGNLVEVYGAEKILAHIAYAPTVIEAEGGDA